MNLTSEQLAYLKELESPKKRRKFMLDCLVENALGESVKSHNIVFKNGVFKTNDPDLIKTLNIWLESTSTAPETLKVTSDYEVGMSFNGDMLDETKKMFIYSINTHNQNALEFILSGNDPTNILNMYLLTIQKMYHHVTGLKIDFIDELFPQLKNDQSAKSNYSPEEIEIAKSLNSEREEKKWTDADMSNAFHKGVRAMTNSYFKDGTIDTTSKEYERLSELRREFEKPLKND
jgi:hypothetical protein